MSEEIKNLPAILSEMPLKIVQSRAEEEVRQKLIRKMTLELGYPKGLIAVEKEISSRRRVDLICYTPVQEKLVPLLLVECKAVEVDEAAARQVFGYNSAIGAPFLCLVSANEIKTFWHEKGKLASIAFLPTYEQLQEKLCLFL